MPDCLVPPPPFPASFSPDNPCLSSCCLTPISISHCHILHHSNPLYSQPPLLPLLSEALQTRRWLLYTMAPVFMLLFTCLQTAPLHKEGKNLNSSHAQGSLCSSIHYALPQHQCEGLVTILCQLVASTDCGAIYKRKKALFSRGA